jgi:ferritin-like metal-binding protein YciE
MKDSKSEIADWLRDAHAMESNLVNMLEGQVEHLSGFPEIQRSVSRHAEESKRHASLVEDALKLLGEDTSALKDAVAKFTGLMSPLGVGMASDAPVKIVLANYAAEHFEIACYRSLRAAAEQSGFPEIADICLEILEDEENMVILLEPAIAEVTAVHLRNL